MKDFLQKIITQLKNVYTKLNKKQKIILLAIAALTIISIIFLIGYSGKATKVILYSDLNAKDFGEITKKASRMGL